MPIINGLKMACEPCIRGHRSTNCPHAQSRLMVPVRKPGRPLSACPHPKNNLCHCGTVTAAIPRKQTCQCGTSTDHQQGGANGQEARTEEAAMHGVAKSVASPTASSSSSSHRVQKSTKKGAARKQSIDASQLGRIDPSQVNVVSSPVAAYPPNGSTPHVETSQPMYPLAPMAVMPNGNGDSFATGTPIGYSPMFTPRMCPSSTGLQSDGCTEQGASSRTSGTPQNGTSASGGGSGCCGGSRESSNPTTPRSSATTSHHGDVPAAQSSCCSGKQNGASDNSTANLDVSDAVMPPFTPQLSMPMHAMYPFYPQPMIFTYPPQYGSFMQPLQPEQWRQFVSSMAFAQPLPHQGNGLPPQNGADMPAQIGFPPPGATTMGAGTSHQCGCGDGCQCVGCAAHPYNNATQNYVRSAYNAMREDPVASRISTAANTPANGVTNGGATGMATIPEQTTPTQGDTAEDQGKPMTGASCCGGRAAKGDATTPSSAPLTPSSAASGGGEEQTLSASDFFFVSYPFGDCAGDMVSCPCGDDCQCIGCEIHKVNVGNEL